jgi:GNAT superfamily N-acetyltransferase
MSNQENMSIKKFQIVSGTEEHAIHAQSICDLIEESARVRGTGIAKRDPKYIAKKLITGHAVIALDGDRVIGFCYVETWSQANYVANSGLIVDPEYRKHGLARSIKKAAFNLARDLYPAAKVFGITTSGPVMKINSELGYIPVTFSELTQDDEFWRGCSSCPNYDILQMKQRKVCLCTGMLAPSKLEEEAMKLDLTYLILNQKIEKENGNVKAQVDREARFATDFF